MTSIDPRKYQLLVLASALRLYANTKIKVNSSYTPSTMMAAAAALTGRSFNSRDYLGAAQALEDRANG